MNLQKGYAVANAPKIHQLKTDLVACIQDRLEVVEFYSKLMGMWSELENYAKMPHYTCGKCECGVDNKIVKMIEEEKMHQFLMGLDEESFSTIRNQVLALNLLPSLDIILNMAQQEEHHKNVMFGSEEISVVTR